MRHCQHRRLCETLAVTLITSVASMTGLAAQGYPTQGNQTQGNQTQGYLGQERIISQQVVSDTAVPGMSGNDPSVVGSGSSTGSESCANGGYVGDLSASEAGLGDGAGGSGGMQRRSFGQPDLFYNYYTQGYSNQANAQMYLSPLPIPPNVGHTFYTYQPFYPHHMLYAHKDRYHRYYDNGRGMNRTRAVYYSPPIKTAASNFYWNYLRLAR